MKFFTFPYRPLYRLIFGAVAMILGSLSQSAMATVILQNQYHLGEAGSLAGVNNLPQDSVGTRHYTSAFNGNTATVGTAGVVAPGSTAYLNTSSATDQGFFGTSYTGFATDNFAFGVFARASGLIGSGIQGDIFTLGNAIGAFKLSLSGNGWSASVHGASWIGPASGVAGSYVSDEWVHLAVIRASGVSTFYIDGVAQTGTNAAGPVHGNSHLSVTPGGATYFDGLIDEARVVTFSPGESAANILNVLQVPEPSSLSMLLFACIGLWLMRNKRMR